MKGWKCGTVCTIAGLMLQMVWIVPLHHLCWWSWICFLFSDEALQRPTPTSKPCVYSFILCFFSAYKHGVSLWLSFCHHGVSFYFACLLSVWVGVCPQLHLTPWSSSVSLIDPVCFRILCPHTEVSIPHSEQQLLNNVDILFTQITV